MANKIKAYFSNVENLLSLLVFSPLILIDYQTFSIDAYWMILQGERFANLDFFNTIPNSVHSFYYVPQQWLSSLIFYFFCKNSLFGSLLFVFIFYFILMLLAKKYFVLITNDKIKGNIFAFIFVLLFILLSFLSARPHLISFCILMSLLICLEKYALSNNVKNLFPIPILFILQVNIQATCYLFLIFVIFAYLFNFKFLKTKNITDLDYNKTNLMICLVVSILCLFINPYGIDMVTYIFKSIISDTGIKDFISFEMKSLAIDNSGIILLIALVILYVVFYAYKEKIILHFLLLLMGSTILFCLNIRSLIYFLIGFLSFIAVYIKNIDNEKILKKVFGYYKIQIPILFCLILILKIFYFSNYDLYSIKRSAIGFDISTFNGIAESIKSYSDDDDIDLYSDIHIGGYLQYNGFDVYLNSHAEPYLKSINKEKDIINEYLSLQFGRIDIKDFLNSYNFDFLVVNEYDILFEYSNKNLKKVYDNGMFFVFDARTP